SWLEAVRWWSAKVVSAIGIVPIALDLLWRDENVLPVLSAPRVDVATEVPDFGRVAIRIITTASVGIIRHVSRRIKLLVQSLILGRMAMLRCCGRDYKDETRRQVCSSLVPPMGASRKGRRSNWPTEDNPTSPCACRHRRAARLCSGQRISANKSS